MTGRRLSWGCSTAQPRPIEAPDPCHPAMDSSSEIRFSVRYRLGEYLAFVTEHSFQTEEALRETRGAKRLVARLFLQAVASVGFLYKIARLGRCDFVITAAGLSRRTKLGTSSVPWSSVRAVHICTPGYLVELREGAVPIPFRVLGQQQRELFCIFASDKLTA